MPELQPYVQPNATLGFKVGTQTALDTLLAASATAQANNTQGPAVHGSFYLTKDTHRLYVGNENGTLSPVNEGIQFVQAISDLPSILDTVGGNNHLVGQFYYIAQKNILAVCNGQDWVQINSVFDSNSISDYEISIVTDRDDNTSHAIKTYIEQEGPDTTTGSGTITTPYTQYFKVDGGTGVAVTYGNTQIQVNADLVTVPTITVNADYQIDVAAGSTNNTAVVSLNSNSSNNPSSFTIVGGQDSAGSTNIDISVNQSGNLQLATNDTKITGVSLDPAANNGNGFTLALTDNYGTDSTLNDTVDPVIAYGNSGSSSAHFSNGTATLNVYTISEIDHKLAGLDAMRYIGTYGQYGSAATYISYSSTLGTTVELNGTPCDIAIGDSILTRGDLNYMGEDITAGSLLIARSTTNAENASGYIDPVNLVFDVVAGEQKEDTQYHFDVDAQTNDLTLVDNLGIVTGTFAIAAASASDMIAVTKTPTAAGGNTRNDLSVTVSHKTVTTNTTPQTAQVAVDPGYELGDWQRQTSIDVVSGITTNSSGHVTDIQTKNITLKDTLNYFDTNAGATEVGDNANAQNPPAKKIGTIKSSYTMTTKSAETSTASSYINLTSSSLNITADNNSTTQISGETGTTKPGLNIEMVWGSF